MGARKYVLFKKPFQTDGCIVEIGSQRGEGSTDYFIGLSQKLRCPFYTVDVNYDVYIWLAHKAHAFLMSGEEFFSRVFPNMGISANIIYMDGFDWVWEGMEERDFIIHQKDQYKKLGMKLTNENSKQSHLEQAKFIVGLQSLNIGGRILFDDTWPTINDYDGKGGYAVGHLLSNGYKLVSQSQVSKEDKNGYVLLERVA